MSNKPLSVEQALGKAKSLARKGEPVLATQLYRVVLAKFPNNRRALEGLKSLAMSRPGQGGATRDPGPAPAQIGGLIALYNQGRLPEALELGTDLAKRYPDVALIRNVLGAVNADTGHLNEAVASYSKALRLDPGYAEAHNNLGNALNALGRHEAAIDSYSKALKLKPGYAEAHNNLGNILNDLGRHEEAMASLTHALQLKPDFAEAHFNLGNVLKALGKLEEAVASYTKALELNPGYAEAWNSLGAIRKFKTGDPQIAQMLELIADPAVTENDKKHLSFALGKAYDDIGDAAGAILHLTEGNRLRKKEMGYDIGFDRGQFSRIKSLFEAGCFPSPENIEPVAEGRRWPILIVGMPRSGTTLVEQILASHSQVHGAGELRVLAQVVLPILADIQYVDAGRLNVLALEAVRDGYLAGLDGLGDGERRITDKMPLNFRWIGFVLAAMPEAKIVNLQRDPVATCWSVFKHYFASKGNGYACDLVDVAEYYKMYIDLMNFWRETFPNRIYDLDYETLTENQEEETRKLLGYCDLDWEDQCLEFHKTERAVKTASSVQVRQQMYQGSSQTWRKYEPHIQPMLQALRG